MTGRSGASHQMPRTHRSLAAGGRVALRVLVALVSVVALATTGAAWWALGHVLGGFTVSDALSNGARSSGGAMNILLIGLDSRKDQQGNDLPQEILDQLHAGDSEAGGYNTNTLILVHVSADDKVVAFSIPRDDYVAFNGVPGYHHIKIKEAYGLTKAYVAQKLVDEGITDQATLESQGREAGRAATLSAVRNLTGVPIDYFAEVNLAGFYDLAETLGGVEVCLNHPVNDEYSGADFPAGRQRLNASQALAFVRQRHGLENGDLDRTHRQQAFLISVMHGLQSSGTFSDLSKLRDLIAIARKDIVFSAGWDIDKFRRLGSLAAGSAQYTTLPVVRYDVMNGQDVNIVDPKKIRALVRAAFSDGATSTTAHQPSSIVDVVNASSTRGLATEVSKTLTSKGFTAGDVRDPNSEDPTSTSIEYGSGAELDAEDVSGLLGDVPAQENSSLAAGHIRVVLGEGFAMPTTTIEESGTSTSADATAVAETSTTSELPTPDPGKPIAAGDGIPCVN